MHEPYTSLMSLSLDRVASPEEQLELERHLEACPTCAATWERWQAMDRLLSTSPSVNPSRNLAEGIPQMLHEKGLDRSHWGWLTLGLVVVWMVGLAGSCLAIVGLLWWGSRHPLEVAVTLASGAEVLSDVSLLLGALQAVVEALDSVLLAVLAAICIIVTGDLVVLWIWVLVRTGASRGSAVGTTPSESATP